MAAQRHADYDYIQARQQRFSEAWLSGSVERLIEFYDKEDFIYSHHGTQISSHSRSEVRDILHRTFINFDHIKIKTRSLHGHKHFTAWEWTVSCKAAAKKSDGQMSKLDEIAPQRLVGCTLTWWNDNDRIVRSHEYAQVKDCDDGDDEEGFEKVKTRNSRL